MGGRIWAESTVGAGSTFTVALPLAAPVSGDAVAESGGDDVPARFTGRVLLAEDYPANQRIARWMLEKLGLEVDLAPDGRQALAKLESGQYDAVLMDCQMPELDGYEATRAIRASSASYRAIPVIAMTAAALPSDRERCLASGMSDYVSKPVQPKELARVLARWLRATSGD
jgi:CheY-like chemotaxis protein